MMKLLNLQKQLPSARINKEILDAFIEEVNKILGEISSYFEMWKNDSANLNALKTVQRGFHTLRGNGYLVGASVIGELGWQCENLFNQIIEHRIERNETLFLLVERVQKMLPHMVEQFQKNQPVPYEVALLISQICHFVETQGQELGEFESPTDFFIQHLAQLKMVLESYEHKLPLPLDSEIVKIFHTLQENSRNLGITSLTEIITLLEGYCKVLLEKRTLLTKDKFTLFYKATGLIERLLTGKTIDQEEQQALLDNTQIALSIVKRSPSDLSSFFYEATENLERLRSLVSHWHAAPYAVEMVTALQEELQTLENHANQEGVTAIKELCHHLELVLNRGEGKPFPRQQLKEMIQKGIEELATLLEVLRSGKPISISQEFINKINTFKALYAIPNKREIYKTEIISKHELGEFVQVKITLIGKLVDLAKKLTTYRVHLERQQAVVKNNLVEMEQTVIRLRDQSQHLKIETQLLSYYRWINRVNDEELEPLKLNHFPLIQQLSNRFMESVHDLVNIQDSLKILTEQTDILLVQQTRMSAELQDTMISIHKVPFWNIVPPLQRVMRLLSKEFRSQIDFVVNGAHLKFERNLLHVLVALLEFLLRTLIGHGVEFICQEKSSSPKITLQVTQGETEFIIEVNNKNACIDIHRLREKAEKLQIAQSYMKDAALIQLMLQPPLNKREGRIGLDQISDQIKLLGGRLLVYFQIETGTTFKIHLPKFNQYQIHKQMELSGKEGDIEVEMSLIEKLTHLTETVSASGFDMEQQQRAVKNKLNQMEQTATGLRDQLHRLKMEVQARFIIPMNKQEAESQELTHFPLIQELSRNLVEELDILMSTHNFLKTLLRQMGNLLVQQTHVSTELQIVLMHVYMIPFSKITPHLQNVVNLVAKKLHKAVNFVIRGDQIEFERTLLIHMIRPIEMVLENAIAYGIEEVDLRQKMGKLPTAQVLLEIIQAGSETIIKISDDGRGLDPVAIRKKAEELQMIKFNSIMSNQAVMRFVLEPAFKIDRCMGMDRVNSEIEHLGGILLVHSRMTEGVTFEIRFNQVFSNPASLS